MVSILNGFLHTPAPHIHMLKLDWVVYKCLTIHTLSRTVSFKRHVCMTMYALGQCMHKCRPTAGCVHKALVHVFIRWFMCARRLKVQSTQKHEIRLSLALWLNLSLSRWGAKP